MSEAIRVPPHNDEAERSTLGAALIDNRIMGQLLGLLTSERFYRESHRHIWSAMVALHERGEAIDVITLADQLQAEGLLDKVGGPNVLARLSSEVPSSANVMFYAQIAARKAQLRDFIATAHSLIDEAYEDLDGEEHEKWTARAAGTLSKMLTSQHGVDTAKHSKDFTREVSSWLYEEQPDGPRWNTPFHSFNRMLEGERFESGQLIVVGARPGGGKTAWALQVALHNACRGHNALLFSMEMPRVQLAMRMLACHAHVPSPTIKARKNSEAEWQRVIKSLGAIRDAAIWVDERASLTLHQIEAECARLTGAGHPPAIVVVDYLQLVRPADQRSNKADQLELIAQGLKEIALRNRCVVIALAQLNRGSDSQAGAPGMGSLRGSSGIEAAADVVALLWREDEGDGKKDEQGGPPAPSKAHDGPVYVNCAIAKNRGGSTGQMEYQFHGAEYRFVDLNAEDDR
jgi:replicative DNA helicase